MHLWRTRKTRAAGYSNLCPGVRSFALSLNFYDDPLWRAHLDMTFWKWNFKWDWFK